jgi:subtilisin family serine protease
MMIQNLGHRGEISLSGVEFGKVLPWIAFLCLSILWQGVARAQSRLFVRPPSRAEVSRPDRVLGEYIVVLRNRADLESVKKTMERNSALSRDGAKIKGVIERFKSVHIEIPGEHDLADIESEISRDHRIEFVEPNYLYYTEYKVPADRHLNKMWHLGRIAAYQAWDARRDGTGVTAAVLDTGFFVNHEDLKANVIDGKKDFGRSQPDDDPSPEKLPASGPRSLSALLFGPETASNKAVISKPEYNKFEIHGTHVLGLLGAVGDNGLGIVGIGWKPRLLPLKCSSAAHPNAVSTASALRAIDYALLKGAKVINLSWGAHANSKALRSAIADARGDALFVAAAGNDASDNDVTPHYPSGFNDLSNLISVGATGRDDSIAAFSNFGQNRVDIAAPGVAMLSTIPRCTKEPDLESDYIELDGTSMATPLVSGAAVLVLDGDPRLTPAQVKEIILHTADRIPGLVGKIADGRRLNLARAVLPPLAPGKNLPASQGTEQPISPSRRYRLFLESLSARAPDNRSLFEVIVNAYSVVNQSALVRDFERVQGIELEKAEKLPSRSENLFLITVRTSMTPAQCLQEIEKLKAVRWAEPNQVFKPERPKALRGDHTSHPES